MKKQFILALFMAIALLSFNKTSAAVAAEMCTVEHCKNLMSVRAYNKGLCKTKAECLAWLANNNICSAKQITRCKIRDTKGLAAVPDLRSDGMDY